MWLPTILLHQILSLLQNEFHFKIHCLFLFLTVTLRKIKLYLELKHFLFLKEYILKDLVSYKTKVVVTFFLRLRNEFQAFPTKNWASCWFMVQAIRGLVFGKKWLEFISQSQIKSDYNFSKLPILTNTDLNLKTSTISLFDKRQNLNDFIWRI